MQKRVLQAAALVAVGAVGCSAVLGLDETTLQPPGGADGGGTDAAPPGHDAAPPLPDASPDGATPPVDAGGPSFSTKPAMLRALRDASVPVEIDLARGGLQGPVDVSLTGLPTGVTSTSATIAADASTTTLSLTASATAAEGSAQAIVRGAGVPDLTVPLLVAGQPGTLDETWGGSGIVTDKADGVNGTWFAVVAQPDGKVIAAGAKARDGSGGWVVRRYAADGSPDTAFDTAAAAAMPATGGAAAIAIDPQTSKIVVVGTSGSSPAEATIVRLTPAGAADVPFGNSGVFVFDVTRFGGGSTGHAVYVQADSSIVVAGSGGNGQNLGTVTTVLASGSGYAQGPSYMAQVPSVFYGIARVGSTFVVGGTESSTPPKTLVAKLGDSTFGDAGAVELDDGCSSVAFIAEPNGQLVAGGTSPYGPNLCMTSASATGAPGWSFTANGGNFWTYTGLVAQPDSAFLDVGYGGSNNANYSFVERRTPDAGNSDPAFNGGQPVTFGDTLHAPPLFVYQLHAIALQPDGRILAAGNKNDSGLVVIRLWP